IYQLLLCGSTLGLFKEEKEVKIKQHPLSLIQDNIVMEEKKTLEIVYKAHSMKYSCCCCCCPIENPQGTFLGLSTSLRFIQQFPHVILFSIAMIKKIYIWVEIYLVRNLLIYTPSVSFYLWIVGTVICWASGKALSSTWHNIIITT
ncbi:hypothetical protein ACJX0J_031585, partial [Zea mays]